MPTTLLNPYCTLEQVQQEIRNSDAAYEDKIKDRINLASRYIDEKLHRDFLFHDHSTELFKVQWSDCVADEIFLSYPIITIEEVDIIGGVIGLTGTIDRLLEAAEQFTFENISGGGVITLDRHTPPAHPKNAVKIKGTFGYVQADTATPPTDIPISITKAAILIAAAWSGEYKIEKIAFDGSRTSLLEMHIPKEAFALLNLYMPIIN
jgi:hypothetical protein